MEEKDKRQTCTLREFQEVRETLEIGMNFFNKAQPELETYEPLYATRVIQG